MSHTNALRMVLLAVSIAATAHSADETCKVLFDADRKMLVTAHHSYSTRLSPDQKQSKADEAIYTGGLNGAVYILVSGKWQRSGMGPEAVLKQKEENIRNTKASCRYVRDEAVNGEAAAMYSIHTESEGDKSDGSVWIGKSRGMPVREEIDMGVSPDKMHMVVRYDYTNVRAPDGVK
jgi:hypothetical protein